MSSAGKTVDVLIGSPRDSFWDTVLLTLKGYYPYKLTRVRGVDEILDNPDTEFKPVLAIIDGQDGTAVSNEWVQAAKMTYDCPLIVLHSSAAPLDFNVVKKNGANEVMHMNFDRELISDMVLQMAPIEFEGDNIPITALMPVDMRDIEAGMNINFDVYAHLPANHKSILLRKSGDILDERQVEKFRNMRQQMYVRKTQMKEFFEYARTIMSMRNIPFPVSMTEKFQRSKKAIYQIMAQFLNAAATDFNGGKEILTHCKNIITDFDLTKDFSEAEIFSEVSRFSGNIRTNYHDCICLAAYAAHFAQLLGWDATKREEAALAGLLHNIGLSQIDLKFVDKKISEMSPGEREEYIHYPDRSVTMVKSKKVPLSPQVSDGIGQHRELGTGEGFPKKISGNDLSEFGKLLIIAYNFHILTALQDGKASLAPTKALEQMKDNAVLGPYDFDLKMTTTIAKKIKS